MKDSRVHKLTIVVPSKPEERSKEMAPLAPHSPVLSNNSYRCDGKSNPATHFLPILDERHWPEPLRAVLYLIAIAFVFNGVSHAVDVFMGGIEKICAHTIKVKNKNSGPGEPEYKFVNVWNTTVATLTLGAAGTCSPEILLTTIEVVSGGFDSSTAGTLGPGTIIGSAAFNLMVTTAICIVSVPKKETRKIQQMPVYITTTVFSIFAYVWLIIIMIGSSPQIIEVWEAAVTFALYPLLVISAYYADKMVCFRRRKDTVHALHNGLANGKSAELVAPRKSIALDHEAGALYFKTLEKEAAHVLKHGTAEEMAQWTADQIEAAKPKTTAYYRAHGHGHHNVHHKGKGSHAKHGQQNHSGDGEVAMVDFAAKHYAVREEDKIVMLRVLRSGNINCDSVVRYETLEGTATPDEDFVHRTGVLIFEPGEIEKTIEVEIVDTEEPEADEVFYVKLSLNDSHDTTTRLGRHNPAEVTILGVVESTLLEFKDRRHMVKETVGFAELKVQRKGKANQVVVVHWSTNDLTAKDKVDYVSKSGDLRFEPGEQQKCINVGIIDTVSPDKNATFGVRLESVDGGEATLGEKRQIIVTIISDDEVQERLAQADKLVSEMLKDNESWSAAWRKQFVKAMNVNDGDIDGANAFDYFMHFVSFGWKSIFAALIPPPELGGGYMTFIAALFLIGVLTAIVSDLANLFGCICGLDDVLVGAMLVSVGTNLPDLLASRFAAIADDAADNAVGHISGSCSINVYLGLGIPWLFASIYKESHNEKFRVNTEELGHCVMVYCLLSVVSIAILILRRRLKYFGQAELGGPSKPKIVSAIILVIMWIGYLLFTAFKDKH